MPEKETSSDREANSSADQKKPALAGSQMAVAATIAVAATSGGGTSNGNRH